MNAKIRGKKSPIHENADANITFDFGDRDISRFRSRWPHGHKHGHIISSIIVRLCRPYADDNCLICSISKGTAKDD